MVQWCPHCMSSKIVKNGKRKSKSTGLRNNKPSQGKQLYKCNECNKKFIQNTRRTDFFKVQLYSQFQYLGQYTENTDPQKPRRITITGIARSLGNVSKQLEFEDKLSVSRSTVYRYYKQWLKEGSPKIKDARKLDDFQIYSYEDYIQKTIESYKKSYEYNTVLGLLVFCLVYSKAALRASSSRI